MLTHQPGLLPDGSYTAEGENIPLESKALGSDEWLSARPSDTHSVVSTLVFTDLVCECETCGRHEELIS